MAKLSGKQCRQARSLLKWNLHDLVSHVKSIPARRIDNFEHGLLHLQAWENDELVGAFKKAGIAFKADFEVSLAKDDAKDDHRPSGMQGDGAHIVISAEEAMMGGEPEKPGAAEEQARKEEDKRREGKK